MLLIGIFEDCIFIADADPEYFFTEKFKKKKKLGYTNRPVKFLCTVNDESAKIRWCWNGKPISVNVFFIQHFIL